MRPSGLGRAEHVDVRRALRIARRGAVERVVLPACEVDGHAGVGRACALDVVGRRDRDRALPGRARRRSSRRSAASPSRKLFDPASRTSGSRGSTVIVAFVCGPGQVRDVHLGASQRLCSDRRLCGGSSQNERRAPRSGRTASVGVRRPERPGLPVRPARRSLQPRRRSRRRGRAPPRPGAPGARRNRDADRRRPPAQRRRQAQRDERGRRAERVEIRADRRRLDQADDLERQRVCPSTSSTRSVEVVPGQREAEQEGAEDARPDQRQRHLAERPRRVRRRDRAPPPRCGRHSGSRRRA